MLVRTREEAWRIAKLLMPSSYSFHLDPVASTRSGYEVYSCDVPHSTARILDLNTRLEVVFDNGHSEMIWIKEMEECHKEKTIVLYMWEKAGSYNGFTVRVPRKVVIPSVESLSFIESQGHKLVSVHTVGGEVYRLVIGEGFGEVFNIEL